MTGLGLAATFRARLRARRPLVLGVALTAVPAAVALAVVSADPGAGGPLSLLGATVVFLALAGGWLGPELGSGAALFWIQTPHPPLLLYGARFAVVSGLAAILAWTLPGATALVLAVLGHTTVAGQILGAVPGHALYLALFAVLVWGTGGWGVPGDTWAGPALGAALVGLELVVRFQPDALGPLVGPADLVGLPLDDLGSASAFLSGARLDPGPLWRVLPWLGAWILLGAFGVHRSARRAGMADRAS